MGKLTKKEIEVALGANMVSKNRNGNYVARWGYFYKMGRDVDRYVEKIKNKFETVEIIDKGDIFLPFRGGSPIKKQSHFWVEFNFPTEVKK